MSESSKGGKCSTTAELKVTLTMYQQLLQQYIALGPTVFPIWCILPNGSFDWSKGYGKPPPWNLPFISLSVIMRVLNRRKKTRVSDGATCRLEDTTKATEEERGTAQDTPYTYWWWRSRIRSSKRKFCPTFPRWSLEGKDQCPSEETDRNCNMDVRSMSNGKIEVVEEK